MKKGKSKYELMLRLTQNGKRKFKSIKSGITVKEWDTKNNKLKGVRPSSDKKYQDFLENKKLIDSIEKKFIDQINKLLQLQKPFSMDKVIQLVENPTKINTTVFEIFDAWNDELEKTEKYGSRSVNKGILSRFKGWHSDDLMFNELDDVLLLNYRNYLLKEGLKPVSVSIHLRAFRALYNRAIQMKIADRNDYPFLNKELMKGLKGGRTARALKRSDVEAIRKTRINKLKTDSDAWHAANYFIFGYVGRGINFTDIARLKWENCNNDKITFIRHKTRSKIQEQTRFTVTAELKEILAYYHTKRTVQNPYIFPILNAFHNTEARRHNRIAKVRKAVNKELKAIGEDLELPIKLTTYVWRHTFATVAKNELNVGIPMISEMLGHHDLATTEAYLKQFEDEDKDIAVIGL